MSPRLVETFLTADHARLDRLLAASQPPGGEIDPESYARFRHDLLRHIAMEEKVLLPFAKTRRGGQPLPIADRLRHDHSAIARLLVRSPTATLIDELRGILEPHDLLEEGPAGLYAICDALAGEEAPDLLARLHAVPRVPVAKYYDGPIGRR